MAMIIRQKCNFFERIQFLHHELEDYLSLHGKIDATLRRQCLMEVGITVDESKNSNDLRKYDPY